MRVVPGGHYLPEQCPDLVANAARELFASQLQVAGEGLAVA
jgi:hypothetical protein